tara:strand:- start:452 stop:832 length:381 start_codon:yes stop_codon:yes gene_type:complete
MKENELKQLNTELKALKTYEKSLIDKRKILQNKVNSNVNECKTVRINIKSKEKDIEKLTKGKNTIVSEHAILRYLERVCGMDIENIKTLILNDEFKALNSLANGEGTIKMNDIEYVLKNNVIITIK